MTRCTERLPVKIAAIFLLFFLLILAALSFYCIIVAVDGGYYEHTDEWFGTYEAVEMVREAARQLAAEYCSSRDDPEALQALRDAWQPDRTNLSCVIVRADAPEQVLFRNFVPEETGYTETIAWLEDGETYRVTVRLPTDMTARDRFWRAGTYFEITYSLRYTAVVVLGISLLLALIVLIFLCCAAGHRRDVEGVVLNGLDRIPFDLVLAVVAILLAFLIGDVMDQVYSACWGGTGVSVT